MFKKSLVVDMVNRSSETPADRRNFLRGMGLISAGAVGAGLIAGAGADRADAAEGDVSDGSVLNFALNLEYLEAEFYSFAAYGHGLADNLTTGTGTRGGVTGGHRVPFKSKAMRYYAEEIPTTRSRTSSSCAPTSPPRPSRARPSTCRTPSPVRPSPPASSSRARPSTPSRTRPASCSARSSSRTSGCRRYWSRGR